MEQDMRRVYNRIAKERYQQGGKKTGKQLAGMLRKKSINFIGKIKDREEGEMVFSTPKIAKVFKKYYSTLYSINQMRAQEKETNRREKIRDYLIEVKLPKITEDKLKRLENPISEEEINLALKKSPIGKSPGP